MLVASFVPEYRVWGLNWWAYYPLSVKLIVFLAVGIWPWLLILVERQSWSASRPASATPTNNRSYYLVAGSLGLIFCLGFYLLQVETFFLGDGYAALALTAQNDAFMKSSKLGETLAHLELKSLFDMVDSAAALMSFRVISIFSGILFLIIVTLSSARLFADTGRRLLFLFGLASGGYMILFFGYVEYYSLFSASVALITCLGVLIADGRMNRWFMAPAVGLAVFLHIMGAILIPAALYVLVAGSSTGKWLAHRNRNTKLALAAAVALGAAGIFVYLYSTSMFFRLSFLPILENRFTVEGYTLFSVEHLWDYVNLVVLLVPGLAVLLMAVRRREILRLMKQDRAMSFLSILTLSAMAATFVLDPKLGMPRDWDLFAFCGIPLAALLFYPILRRAADSPVSRIAAVGAVALGFLSLWPRALALHTPDLALRHVDTYLALDTKKNRATHRHLVQYYLDIGDTSQAVTVRNLWESEYPERRLFREASQLRQQGQINEATRLFRKAAAINPAMSDVWSHVALCLSDQGMYDSAVYYCRVSIAYNPDVQQVHNSLGTNLFQLGRYSEAEEAFLDAYRLSDSTVMPLYNVALLHKHQGHMDKHEQYLRRVALHPHTAAQFVVQLAEYYVRTNRVLEARELLSRTVGKTIDSVGVAEFLERYPQLK